MNSQFANVAAEGTAAEVEVVKLGKAVAARVVAAQAGAALVAAQAEEARAAAQTDAVRSTLLGALNRCIYLPEVSASTLELTQALIRLGDYVGARCADAEARALWRLLVLLPARCAPEAPTTPTFFSCWPGTDAALAAAGDTADAERFAAAQASLYRLEVLLREMFAGLEAALSRLGRSAAELVAECSLLAEKVAGLGNEAWSTLLEPVLVCQTEEEREREDRFMAAPLAQSFEEALGAEYAGVRDAYDRARANVYRAFAEVAATLRRSLRSIVECYPELSAHAAVARGQQLKMRDKLAMLGDL